ncbi:phosphopantothenoylcysteine decarboxylase / phosphopantothenate--cysteine ligase [Sanguibacter gelidistatuariae]|uniref:Coenzyme A biosynthesis bifunctional protein CoaBC n=1 Tax=Sanguibacter gelidistatuariae TaxID=1814289 RepID=A0A1G6JL52_9MICO|nr:bifunctional phosphopantothenoylcysteine decarboxylase/phosphopantothenate--cysteine ligase CoaBC [Sanguibacter gelidistatuariae]SDC19398.1 phosphopantothenoylcysteine decarboxylase / phosphopantothenate--cysteine ligase [Sanguibacter gelidistatuariae]
MRVILGVSGGIAAYKAVLLLRLLAEAGHSVRVIPTESALRFVGAPTWEALSGKPVTTTVFDDVPHVPHVALGQEADLVVVAPATADLLSRMATGRSDDLLTATLLTARCPVLVAPAMHTEMWLHPAVEANVATLRSRGVTVLDPASGRLTGADTGPGRLPEPEDIFAAAMALTVDAADGGAGDLTNSLTGTHVLISAGGTREPIDPVRFIGNRSSGRQGYALAAEAHRRGALVTLVAANVDLPDPAGVAVVHVETTQELAEAVREGAESADLIIMAAAIADFRPATVTTHKVKKTGDGVVAPIELVVNPDILAGLVEARPDLLARRGGSQVIVGFAAETGDATGDVLQHGRAKAARKGADLLVVNPVGGGRGFGDVDNDVTILTAAGDVVTAFTGSKDAVARAILDEAAQILTTRS